MPERKYTDDQLVAAYEEQGSYSKVAKALDMNLRSIERRFARMRRKGYSPQHDMTHMVPDGYRLKGTSTLYDEAGQPRLQWVKSQVDAERQAELMEEAIRAMADSLPRAKPLSAAPSGIDSLLNCYIITDYHFGMMAWHEETGDDWDLKIAEEMFVSWFFEAIRMSPVSKTAVLANIADLLHWDGMEALTPASKHVLDADTRFQKLVRVVIRAIRKVVDMLLRKHEMVHIIMAEGNHDPASSVWLRELFSAHYEDEPRVTVDTNADPYYCVEHGQTSLFFHHGHRRKPAAIDDVFVSKFREVFGRTKYSYAHMGHLHHINTLETNLMVVEQHRTMAAKDAYASTHGYMSGRSASVITYHKDYGEVSRLTISPEMLV